tara:strand:+ start:474 stop:776 length:303 start_codon:yes stop_codon:yes gene_type:complete
MKRFLLVLKIFRKALWIFISIGALSGMTHSLLYDLPRASGLENQITVIGGSFLFGFIFKWMFFLLDTDPNRQIFSFKIPNNPASILSVFLGVFWGVINSR